MNWSKKPLSDQDTNDTGDSIQIGNVGEKAAVAAGRGAKALSIGTLQLDMRLWPVVVILLGVIVALAYFLWPKNPEAMTGEFNVAVAEFTVLDEDGQPIGSQDGENFADFLFQRLELEFAGLDLSIPYELWPPGYTGQISGTTPQERAQAGEKRADEINANILVYGFITQGGAGSQVHPEFFVNYRGFEQAEELTGEHELGRPVRLDLPFDPAQFQGVDNPALTARIKALNLITIGLAYLMTDNHDQAYTYFVEAESTPGWLTSAGKEVVYLLLGNTHVRRATMEKSSVPLMEAQQAFENALQINPDYARAQVGLAGTLYLQALGDPEDPSFDTVDPDKLTEAEAAFQNALQAADAPDSAEIPAKVHNGLGQVYLVRAQIGETEWISRAQSEFEAVVSAFVAGDTRLADLAGHAYARLGFIALMEGDTDTAVERLSQAAELVTPFWQGHYTALAGDIYASLGHHEQAREAYQKAVQIAEQFGYQDSAETYLEKIRELKSGG